MADYSIIDTPNGPRPKWWPQVKEVDRDEAEVLWRLGVPVYHVWWFDDFIVYAGIYDYTVDCEDELNPRWYEKTEHYFFYVKP